jgi:phytol kinase
MGVALVSLWLAAVLGLALWTRRRWTDQPEWSRKVLHIGTGPVVLIAWATGIDRSIALPVAALVTLLAALNHRLRVLPARTAPATR